MNEVERDNENRCVCVWYSLVVFVVVENRFEFLIQEIKINRLDNFLSTIVQ